MIVHIGFPRCGSTTLQQLFAASDGHFLGCNPKAAAGAFYDPAIGTLLEGPLRLGSQRQFDQHAPAVRDRLAALGPKAILSYENLAFRLTPFDLPTDIKLQRLGALVPRASTVGGNKSSVFTAAFVTGGAVTVVGVTLLGSAASAGSARTAASQRRAGFMRKWAEFICCDRGVD